MVGRVLLSCLLIMIAWMTFDFFLHRLFLAPLYKQNATQWRPFDQMNVGLIYIVTLALIGTFVGTFVLLVEPKSLHAGITFGLLFGLALGVSAGFGTYIHSPIPLALAWGWFFGGWVKGILAGAIVGLVIHSSPS